MCDYFYNHTKFFHNHTKFGGIMGKNAVNIGQHYFHNEDLSEAKIHIMKIMLTDIHGIIIIMS